MNTVYIIGSTDIAKNNYIAFQNKWYKSVFKCNYEKNIPELETIAYNYSINKYYRLIMELKINMFIANNSKKYNKKTVIYLTSEDKNKRDDVYKYFYDKLDN